MNMNPKYHFFKDELEPHEIQYYSNGRRLDEERWSTPEIANCATKIKEELLKRGYKLCKNNSHKSLYFSKPEGVSAAYVGTFLNIFSCNEKVWNWYNQFATTAKYIVVSEVERNNGTTKNQSVSIGVLYFPGLSKVEYFTSNNRANGGKVNNHGVEIPKKYNWCSAGSSVGKSERIKKLRVESSDKIIFNAIKKAEDMWNMIKIEDQSKFEKDYNDFPPSTEKEYKIYWEEKKNK